jgi:hypothetical protein
MAEKKHRYERIDGSDSDGNPNSTDRVCGRVALMRLQNKILGYLAASMLVVHFRVRAPFDQVPPQQE